MKTAKIEPAAQPIPPDLAATLLHLPADDYSVAFYQAMGLFENEDYQGALSLFIFAAEHYCLHSLPYLQCIKAKKEISPKLDPPTKARMDTINEWSKYLDNIDIEHKEFYSTSCEIVALRKLAKKSSTPSKTTKNKSNPTKKAKPSQYEKQLKSFMTTTSSCSHHSYQKALFSKAMNKPKDYQLYMLSAAAKGHLLAIAELCRLEQGIIDSNEFLQKITRLAYHQEVRHFNFAQRIYDTAVSIPNPIGKLSFHFESVRLGVVSAFPTIALMYFIHDEKYNQAFGLLTLGIRANDPTAIIYLSHILTKQRKIQTFDYDIAPATIVNLLLRNLRNTHQQPAYNFHQRIDFERTVITESMQQLCMYAQNNGDNPEIHNNTELLDIAEQQFQKNEENIELRLCISSLVSCLSIKKIYNCGQLSVKVSLAPKAIYYLEYLWRNLKKTGNLLDLFYISLEYMERYHQLHPDDIAAQSEIVLGLIALIKEIEALLGNEISNPKRFDGEHAKYIEYCICTYQPAIRLKLSSKNELKQQYQKYLHLAKTAGIKKYIITIATAHLSGNMGFELNFREARTLLESLGDSEKSSLDVIRLMAYSYFHDDTVSSKLGIELKLKFATRYPELYFDVAECYCDGYIGINPDQGLAEQYYRKAIAGGYAEGHVGMAIMLFERQLVENHDKYSQEILGYLQYAYKENSADAAFFLGRFYLWGQLVAKDLEQAREYFEIAVQRADQPYAKAFLDMIAYGYKGEASISLELELVKLESLKMSGYIDLSAFGSMEYGLIYLLLDPQEGIKYILKAAKHNNLSSQYLLATFQSLIDNKLSNFSSEIIASINKANFRHLYRREITSLIDIPVKQFFELSIIINKFILLNYTITADYISELIDRGLFSTNLDLSQIEDEIKDRFAPEDILKTKLLANRFFSQQKSGDEECARMTQDLLAQKKSQSMVLTNKFTKHEKTNNLSMNHLGSCLKAFLNSGATAEAADLKAIKAALKIHPPHGRGDRNQNQDLEGGRRKTAEEALDVMAKSCEFKY
jgi:TPR repeat protein